MPKYKADAYLRLSYSADHSVESDSIANQKKLIEDFVAAHPDIELVSERVDDGYSGVLFDRPAFQEMMNDIVSGKINCVIVKDLSRLGREYIETGRYLRQVFPTYGVRFISVNDGIDTANEQNGDDLHITLKNLLNDTYSHDISVKTRSALLTKRQNGDYVGSCPIYGYRKDPEMLIDLCAELVPQEVQQEIRSRLDAERAAEQAEEEAARKYTAFCVREDGAASFFQLDRKEDILEVAKFLRRYLREGQSQGTAALRTSAFARMELVTAERYDQLLALRMETPNKVTGVFDLDFDKQEVSTTDAAEGWKTWSMQDVSTAVYHAYRKGYLSPERYMARFLEKLEGKELTSAGHLSAKEISLAEDICEMDGRRLNFYLETCFDVDAVFGTHVCTEENDDTLNVYADYDMASGQVCEELEVDLHWADGREEAVEYRLNAVEKAVLLRKMGDYCWQQNGMSLADYSAQLLDEGVAPPSGPSM